MAKSELDKAIATMIRKGVYEDPSKFFEWVDKKRRNLPSDQTAANLALRVGDAIALTKNSSQSLGAILSVAERRGVTPVVNTESLRYKASDVIHTVLTQDGKKV